MSSIPDDSAPHRSVRWRSSIEWRWGKCLSIAGALTGAAILARIIIASGSSTNVLGIVMLPLYAISGAIGGWIWGAALAHVVRCWRTGRILAWSAAAATGIVVALPAPGLLRLHEGLTLRYAVRAVATLNADELEQYFTGSPLARNPYVVKAIANNGMATGALIDRIARAAEPGWYDAHDDAFFGLNPRGDRRWSAMAVLVRHRNMEPDTLRHLAQAPHAGNVLDGILEHPRAPRELLIAFGSRLDTRGVRYGLSGNRNTPPELLDRLSGSPESYNRARVAGNPSTPTATLKKLAWDDDYRVRDVAARALDNRRR